MITIDLARNWLGAPVVEDTLVRVTFEALIPEMRRSSPLIDTEPGSEEMSPLALYRVPL